MSLDRDLITFRSLVILILHIFFWFWRRFRWTLFLELFDPILCSFKDRNNIFVRLPHRWRFRK